MRKLIIWGLGFEWKVMRPIIESNEILNSIIKDEIVAYTDIDKNKKYDYKNFAEISELNEIKPDLLLVPSGRLKESIERTMKEYNYKFKVITFSEYIKSKINLPDDAIGYGDRIIDEAYLYKYWTELDAKVIMEIGANYGQDANILKVYYNVNESDVYVFEPHPVLVEYIRNNHKFNTYNYAVGNIDGEIDFYLSDFKTINSGSSTCMPYEFTDNLTKIKVPITRMDSFLKKNPQIKEIDFLKVDVEGIDYEVLESFGDYLKKVKCIQTEAEQYSRVEGQHTFDDICKLLLSKGFELVKYENHGGEQSDSMWIRKDLIIRGYKR